MYNFFKGQIFSWPFWSFSEAEDSANDILKEWFEKSWIYWWDLIIGEYDYEYFLFDSNDITDFSSNIEDIDDSMYEWVAYTEVWIYH